MIASAPFSAFIRNGQVFSAPSVVGTARQPLITNNDGTTSWATLAYADISGLASAATHPASDFDSVGAASAALASAISVSCQRASNLNDVANAGTARTNLGLGALAVLNAADLSGSQATGILAAARFPALTGDVTTVAGALASTVAKIAGTTVSGTTGSGNVVFSVAPTFTGVPLAPTAAANTNTTQIATTEFVTTANNLKVDKYTFVSKSANYTLLAGQASLVDISGGSNTQTLPTAPADNTECAVKIVVIAGTNTCTVICGGSDTFNVAGGATSVTLRLNGQAQQYIYRAATTSWVVIADDLSLTQLDARYALLSGATFTGAIGTTAIAAGGDLTFTGTAHAGLVINSLTTTQRDAISSPVVGSLIYNTTTGRVNAYIGSAWTTGYVRLDGDAMTGLLTLNAGLAFSTDLFVTRKGAANIQLGAADAAAPIAQTWSVQNVVAGTTNTVGVNVTYGGSQGTGTGVGGSHIFQVAPAGVTGGAQNALVTALTLAADASKTATFAGSINLAYAAVASVPALQTTGTLFTGGSTTTTFPQYLAQTSSPAAVTSWSTAGTYFGANANSGFAGNFIDFHTNGGGSLFKVTSTGSVASTGTIQSANFSATQQYLTTWAGAASNGVITSSGAPFSGGTGTTTFPQWFANVSTATAATNWSTAGTVFGANVHTSVGNFVDYKVDGTTKFAIAGTGIPTFAGTNTTGAGTALLGANSPAVTNTAPYTWLQVVTADGSTGYIPVWK